MSDDFQKPFASPPTIFSVSLLLALPLGLLWPWPLLPWGLQLILGPLLIVAGVLLIRSSITEITAADTTYDPYAASTKLVTSGIYQHSRNPGYLGLFVIQCGAAILFDNIWIMLAAFIAAAITTKWVIHLEEAKLINTFGDSYTTYQQHVRRWI